MVHYGQLLACFRSATRCILFRQILASAERFLSGAGDYGDEQRRLFIKPCKEIVPVPVSIGR